MIKPLRRYLRCGSLRLLNQFGEKELLVWRERERERERTGERTNIESDKLLVRDKTE